jgi:hypothetical protein
LLQLWEITVSLFATNIGVGRCMYGPLAGNFLDGTVLEGMVSEHAVVEGVLFEGMV